MVFLGGSGLNAARGGGFAGVEQATSAHPAATLTPRSRSGRPVRRPPHIAGVQSARRGSTSGIESWFMRAAKGDKAQTQTFTGIVAAPPLPPSEQERDPDDTTAPRCDVSGHKYAVETSPYEEVSAGCIGGRMQRPDTCYLTHVYVKQEITYLSRRVDEITRYFLSLEQMLGTGMLGPLLQKSSQEVEAKIEAASTLEDTTEIRGLIDAAVRLGFGAHHYAPLRDRLDWLDVGRHREDVRRRVAELEKSRGDPRRRQHAGANAMAAAKRAGNPIALVQKLQRLLDEATHLGLLPSELSTLRQCIQEAEQLLIDEQMLAAAAQGDVGALERALRHGADIDACRMEDGASVWHLAIELPSAEGLAIARLAARLGADAQQPNSAGHTPLMMAAALQKEPFVSELLDYGVDPDLRSSSVEQMVECSDKTVVVDALKNVHDKTRRVLRRFDVSGFCFDPGDELLGGEDLQLPIFRRAALRSALHFAMSRAGIEGAEVLVMEVLIRKKADINVSDESGCTPLWYAVHAGLLGSVRKLLLQGARVVNTNGISVLMAAHNCHVYASSSGNDSLAAKSATIARHLIRSGACDAAGSSFNSGFVADCRYADNVEEAIVMSGGTPDVIAGVQEQSLAFEETFAQRLRLQTAQRLTSAQEAADFAAAALPAFQQLLFSLARETGGHAISSRRPTANRLLRMARAAGYSCLARAADETAVDWARIIGAVYGRLEYHDVSSLSQALRHVGESLGFHIRGFQDRLFGNSTSHEGHWQEAGRCFTFMVEVNGAICALHATVGRVAELEEVQFAEGGWLRSELSSAIQQGSVVQVRQALEHAAAYLGELRLGTVLRMPLSIDHGSPTGPAGGDLHKDTPICAAIRARCLDIVDVLLQSGASPNTISAEGLSALTLAMKSEDTSLLELLLAAGADPSSADLDQVETSASKMEAARLIMQVTTQRQLDAKALADLVEHWDDSPESLQEAFVLLQAGADANTMTSGLGPIGERMSVLSCATKHGSQRLVRMLLNFKAQVHSTGGGRSALQFAKGGPLDGMLSFQACEELQAAVNTTDIAVIQELLDAGIDPETLFSDIAAHEAKTLIQFVVELPTEIAVVLMEDLLQRGADPERRDGKGRTVLLACVQTGRSVAVVEVLLKYAVDVGAADNKGMTAAMHAAALGSSVTLEALLDAATDKSIDLGSAQDLNGLDTLAHALSACQAATSSMLLARGYKPREDSARTQLYKACRSEDVATVQNLLNVLTPYYPKLVIATEDGEEGAVLTNTPTLLMEAVRLQSVEIVQLLVEHGAVLYPRHIAFSSSSNCCDDGDEQLESFSFQTAWSMAGEHDGVKNALRAGFSQELLMVSKQNHEGAIANLQAEEARGLIPGPDDFEAVDVFGFGSLDYAVESGNEALERWFVERGARLRSPSIISTALAEPVRIGDAETIARRLQAGADVHVVDARGCTLLDWSVIAGNLSGHVWQCVEAAINIVESERDEVQGAPRSSLASLQARNSLPSCPGKTHFSMEVEEIEYSLERRRTVERQSSAESVVRRKVSRSPSKQMAGGDERSVSGRSMGSQLRDALSVASSSCRSASGHSRRKKKDPIPDPRQTHAAVEQLLTNAGGRLGPNVRAAQYCLWAPLTLRQFDTVHLRIRAGADCAVLDEKGGSLAHCALEMANPSVAKSFIEFGADPDQRDHRGRTVIWRAVELKSEELALACIEHGSNLQQGFGNENKGSLAHLALESGQTQMAILLISRGCSPDTAVNGKSVMYRSLELKKPDVARTCLEQKADLNFVDMLTGRSLLHLALDGRMDFAADLINAGVPVSLEDKRGRSTLLVAAAQGHERIVDACLEAGAHPGYCGGPEAWAALKNDHVRLAEHLIRAAAPSRPRGARMSSTNSRMSSLKMGGQRTERSHRHSIQGKQEQEQNLLAFAAEKHARGAVIAWLEMSLRGATMEQSSAEKLAKMLAEWLFEGDVERSERLEELESLAETLFEEGASAAAGDLQKVGAPDELVQQLAHAEMEALDFARVQSKGRRSASPKPSRTSSPPSPSNVRGKMSGSSPQSLGIPGVSPRTSSPQPPPNVRRKMSGASPQALGIPSSHATFGLGARSSGASTSLTSTVADVCQNVRVVPNASVEATSANKACLAEFGSHTELPDAVAEVIAKDSEHIPDAIAEAAGVAKATAHDEENSYEDEFEPPTP